MTYFTFFLVIVAGLIHASWNVLAKKVGGGLPFILLSNLVFMALGFPIIFLNGQVWLTWEVNAWLAVLASGMLHSLYFMMLMRGYRLADLTVVYPIARGSGPLISSICAIIFLGEPVSFFLFFGVLSILFGVFLLMSGPTIYSRATIKQVHSQGVYYGLLTGLFIAAYTVVDAYMVKVFHLPPLLAYYWANCLSVLFLLPMLYHKIVDKSFISTIVRRHYPSVLMVGILSPLSYTIILYTLQSAPLSRIAPMREVSMLFAAILGGYLLGEKGRVIRIIGIGCIGLGVVTLGRM